MVRIGVWMRIGVRIRGRFEGKGKGEDDAEYERGEYTTFHIQFHKNS